MQEVVFAELVSLGGVVVPVAQYSVALRLLLAMRRPNGTLYCGSTAHVALRGALLLDLALRDRVTNDDDGVILDARPTGFEAADHFAVGLAARPGLSLERQLQHGPGVRAELISVAEQNDWLIRRRTILPRQRRYGLGIAAGRAAVAQTMATLLQDIDASGQYVDKYAAELAWLLGLLPELDPFDSDCHDIEQLTHFTDLGPAEWLLNAVMRYVADRAIFASSISAG